MRISEGNATHENWQELIIKNWNNLITTVRRVNEKPEPDWLWLIIVAGSG